MSAVLLNAVAFQACWWACILGAAHGIPWLGPVAVLLFGAHRLGWGVRPAARQAELRLLAVAALIGYVADSALVLAGILTFPPHASLGWPSTLWMVALWVGFAATLRSSMSWLRGRVLLAAAFGAVGGPLAYVTGEKFGAAVLGPSATVALVVVGVEWMLAMPVLVWMAGRAVGDPPPVPSSQSPVADFRGDV